MWYCHIVDVSEGPPRSVVSYCEKRMLLWCGNCCGRRGDMIRRVVMVARGSLTNVSRRASRYPVRVVPPAMRLTLWGVISMLNSSVMLLHREARCKPHDVVLQGRCGV